MDFTPDELRKLLQDKDTIKNLRNLLDDEWDKHKINIINGLGSIDFGETLSISSFYKVLFGEKGYFTEKDIDDYERVKELIVLNGDKYLYNCPTEKIYKFDDKHFLKLLDSIEDGFYMVHNINKLFFEKDSPYADKLNNDLFYPTILHGMLDDGKINQLVYIIDQKDNIKKDTRVIESLIKKNYAILDKLKPYLKQAFIDEMQMLYRPVEQPKAEENKKALEPKTEEIRKEEPKMEEYTQTSLFEEEKKYVRKENLFGIEEGILCQQVNCRGVIGGGLSGAIEKQYPIVSESYKNNIKAKGMSLFGKVTMAKCTDKISVANLYTQLDYGNPVLTKKVYTDVEKLVDAVKRVCEKCSDKQVYIPYMIGCGLGGADWNLVLSKIKALNMPNLNVCYTLDGKSLPINDVPFDKVTLSPDVVEHTPTELEKKSGDLGDIMKDLLSRFETELDNRKLDINYEACFVRITGDKVINNQKCTVFKEISFADTKNEYLINVLKEREGIIAYLQDLEKKMNDNNLTDVTVMDYKLNTLNGNGIIIMDTINEKNYVSYNKAFIDKNNVPRCEKSVIDKLKYFSKGNVAEYFKSLNTELDKTIERVKEIQFEADKKIQAILNNKGA